MIKLDWKRVGRRFILFLFILSVSLSLTVLIFYLMGYRAFVISSPSMGDVLRKGDIVVVRSVDFDALQKDDIITYQMINSNVTVTHRVFRIDQENRQLYTIGDKNDTEDAQPVREDQLIGRYQWRITFLRFLS